MKSRKTFLLRISPELYEALEAWAQQEFRSVNGQIEYILREAVRQHGRAAGTDGESGPPAIRPADGGD
jgi:hypothetical protein